MKYQEFYKKSIESPEQFWNEKAQIPGWHKQPMNTLSKEETNYGKWFIDGILNVVNPCLNKHIKDCFKKQITIIYD